MKITTLILLIASHLLFSQDFSMESKSSVSREINENGIFTNTTNSTFHTFPDFVVQETITLRFQAGAEGNFSKLVATSYDYNKNTIWKIEDIADRTEFFQDFYIAEEFGCCDAQSTKAFFNIENGKKIFSSSTEPLIVKFSDNTTFYISFLSISSSKDFPSQYPYNSNVKIFITLSSNKEVISRLAIKSFSEFGDYDYLPDEKYFLNSPTKEILIINDPYKGKSSLSNVTFEFNYWGAKIIFSIIESNLEVNNEKDFKDFSFVLLKNEDKDSYLFNSNFLNLGHKSKDELRLLRNEIFARNGQSFNSNDLKTLFNKTSWYKERPGHKVSSEELTESEKIVLEKITEFEK